jgi:hypothetical protein
LARYETGLDWDIGETISQRKLNRMVSNMDYLYDQRIKVKYRAHDLSRVSGVRIAAGKVPIGPKTNDDVMVRAVDFNNFFTIGCRPIVVVSLAQRDRARSFVTIRGHDNGLHPTHKGFRVIVAHQIITGKTFTYPRALWVHWMAYGY